MHTHWTISIFRAGRVTLAITQVFKIDLIDFDQFGKSDRAVLSKAITFLT